MRAYETLERDDKVRYYLKNVTYLIRIHGGNYRTPPLKPEIIQATIYSQSHSLKRWKEKKMRLDTMRQKIFAEKDDTIK